MNELLIIGIMAVAFVLMFALTAIIENREAIAEWLFDVQSAYYKWKMRRARKKARR